jgi:glycyl-tRNA synthetase
MKSTEHQEHMEKIVSLCKRRGIFFKGSEIYGGMAGFYDYGPLGVLLKKNVESMWWNMFVDSPEDMYGIDAALVMHPQVYQASGHAKNFADPMVEDKKTGKRYRADHILEENGVDVVGLTPDQMNQIIVERNIKSPDGNSFAEVTQFNMMFQTFVGANSDSESKTFLRPETNCTVLRIEPIMT